MSMKEARSKVRLARKTVASLRGRSRSDDYVDFAFFVGDQIRGEVKGKKYEDKPIIV